MQPPTLAYRPVLKFQTLQECFQGIAPDEFMAARGCDVLELPTGQGLVVKRQRATS